MLAVVSPAKKLNFDPHAEALPFSAPAFPTQAAQLVEIARGLSPADLKALMGISDALADLNHERFQRFSADAGPGEAKQAALAFSGDTYVGLRAAELSPEALSWAQDHLVILSGLYGALRPLDLIQPYRLEMGTRLASPAGKTLYDFWGQRIGEHLQRIVEAHDSPTVINLASTEYFKAVKGLKATVITPTFKEVRGDKARVIGLFAKRARGMMARYMIEGRLTRPEALRDFSEGGYAFRPELSTEKSWVFTRPQP